MLEVEGLAKRYGPIEALRGVSFGVAAGEIVGLLGPNGAGKTTAVSIIAGLLPPDAGAVRLDGAPLSGDTDPRKRTLGLVPQDLALYEELSARDNLRFFGALYGLTGTQLARAIDRVLDLARLSDRAAQKVRTYSGGMKRRLNLAASLLHDPPLLLLDEPTVGVDPQSRNAIFENLDVLKARGKAVLYTTHYMEEAERLCDRIVILDHGRVLADAPLRELHRYVPAPTQLRLELEESPPSEVLEALRALPGVSAVEHVDGMLAIALEDLPRTAPEVLRWLAERGVRCAHFFTHRAGLEEIFLALTGKELRDG